MTYYWTIYMLSGTRRENGKVWVSDGKEEGTVEEDEIVAVFKVRSKYDQRDQSDSGQFRETVNLLPSGFVGSTPT